MKTCSFSSAVDAPLNVSSVRGREVLPEPNPYVLNECSLSDLCKVALRTCTYLSVFICRFLELSAVVGVCYARLRAMVSLRARAREGTPLRCIRRRIPFSRVVIDVLPKQRHTKNVEGSICGCGISTSTGRRRGLVLAGCVPAEAWCACLGTWRSSH